MEHGQFFWMFSFGFFCTFWTLSSLCVCTPCVTVTNSSEPALHPHLSLHITVICEPRQQPRPRCSPAAVGTPRLSFALLCSNPLNTRNSTFRIAALSERVSVLNFITPPVQELMFFGLSKVAQSVARNYDSVIQDQ